MAAVKVKVGRSATATEVDGIPGQDITEITAELLGSRNKARQREALFLAQAFVVAEYEGLVLVNGTTQGKTKLVADEFGLSVAKKLRASRAEFRRNS